MGFWNNLFAKLTGKKAAKFDANAIDGDGDGRIQDGTIWERDASLNKDVIEGVVQDAVSSVLEGSSLPDLQESEEEAKQRMYKERARKAAKTRARNKAKREAEAKAAAQKPAPKKSSKK